MADPPTRPTFSLLDGGPSRDVSEVEAPPPGPPRAGGTLFDRVLAGLERLEDNDPFVTIVEDAMVSPGGFPLHPHQGFETISLVLEGQLLHHDNLGAEPVVLNPGELRWISAGRGILLSERPHGRGTCKMLQLWLNLPAEHKQGAPSVQLLHAEQVPTVEFGCLSVRVIAGTVASCTGPGGSATPVDLWDVHVEEDGEATLPLVASRRGFVIALEGEARLGPSARVLRAGGIARLADEERAGLKIQAPMGARLLVCAGDPIREPVVAAGPFVLNTREELEEAFIKLRLGQFGKG
ncbi:Pirin-like protein [Plesiocystis pacifica SIR-1]|uniref:Pirin-like protein n=1 Tax=Plesiocystis pacifica SIR-1 TaxID=391625 RepID=A6G903_9BACT|nr:pirin family protein [Plesiocystis pacifica]EDM77689.1 Pirin-like protein [Plesiocystis pacifica SIR-1]